MFEEVKVLTHSSIRIEGSRKVYFDPFEVAEEYHDADLIFATHDHFDHFSPEDIAKVAGENTLLILPECMKAQGQKVLEQMTQEQNASGIRCKYIQPGGMLECEGTMVKAIPAYNKLKPFHPKSKGFVGYLLTMDGVVYYVAGDTDATAESMEVECDVALVPVGGKFTMDYKEAAKLVNKIVPRLAIPTHYGSVAGSSDDGQKFADLVDPKITVNVIL